MGYMYGISHFMRSLPVKLLEGAGTWKNCLEVEVA